MTGSVEFGLKHSWTRQEAIPMLLRFFVRILVVFWAPAMMTRRQRADPWRTKAGLCWVKRICKSTECPCFRGRPCVYAAHTRDSPELDIVSKYVRRYTLLPKRRTFL